MNGYALSHGWGGLLVGYVLTGIPMLVALIRRRRPLSRLLLAPLWAVPVALAAGLAWSAVKFLVESGSGVMPAGLVYGAGAVFVMLFGYGVGMLSGRGSPLVLLKRGTHIHDGGVFTGTRG
ncbi:MAG TPA: hypothetical protein VIY90_21200, partial [Steroidobacteraceae bacterium]